jgi:hypothetical protein
VGASKLCFKNDGAKPLPSLRNIIFDGTPEWVQDHEGKGATQSRYLFHIDKTVSPWKPPKFKLAMEL